MKLNENGYKALHEREGLKLKPYLDTQNIPTIGMGNTYYEDNKPVKMTDKPLSKEAAEKLAKNIADKFALKVASLVTSKVNENQFNALVSLAYNIGLTGFKNSTVLRRVNINPNDPAIKGAFMMWTKNPELIGRRKSEVEQYFKKALMLLVLFLIVSCGARKVDKSRTLDISKMETADKSQLKKTTEILNSGEVNLKKSIETTINDKDQTVTVRETIEPIDPLKPSLYDSKPFNNSKKTTETTTKNNNTKTEKIGSSELVEKYNKKENVIEEDKKDIVINTDIKKESDNIKIERSAISLLYWLIPLGILGFIAWRKKWFG